MQSPASSSATATVESSMGDNTSDHRYTSTSMTTANLNPNSPLFGDGNESDGDGDPAVWASFTQNFRQVQSVLDRNRVLIQQVNENHQSKVHDNLVKNVTLIQELNGNISKVVSLYSDLSSNFSNVVQQRNASGDAKSNSSRKK
ncbi:protein EARLY FLOWERING 4 [Sesamum alatum]|uniref:Protein EARLY FLOWERING 4 n=1 Tax=Sesamum alatum TaxID=300844 RepID=A0AAE1YVG6_9LAMI|nr:protein EARLY FLOWERING 4 [Sesamum alatum]